MANLKLKNPSGGSLALVSADGASDLTVTFPAKTGTAMIDGPAFSAYANAGQTVSAGTFTKVAINTEYFDTANCFDSTTNYRFTPNVSGYYQVNGSVSFGTTGAVELIAAVYKNGSIYTRGTNVNMTSATFGDSVITFNEVMYLNGSSDYIELYGLVSANPRSGNGFRYYDTWLTSRFSAAMMRGA